MDPVPTLISLIYGLFVQDCRVVEKLVKETFSDQGPAALIVYVGDKLQSVELRFFRSTT